MTNEKSLNESYKLVGLTVIGAMQLVSAFDNRCKSPCDVLLRQDNCAYKNDGFVDSRFVYHT